MENLSYEVLQKSGYDGYLLKEAPEKVLQFGEGNFLRAFVDYFIDVANEKAGFNAKVVVAQPIENGLADVLNQQEGLYTLYLRGFENQQKVNNKRVVSCLGRCINPYREYDALLQCAHNPDLEYIVSNTTEAGIVYDAACNRDDAPPASFPAKLTRFLYERYQAFGGKPGTGFTILSCELIDHNGEALRRCVEQYIDLWGLEAAFAGWVRQENLFCTTLVDRIVTGYPKKEADALNRENGYEDRLLDCGEVFGFWAIEGPEELRSKLPFSACGLPVVVAADITPYKQRKVRILNGAHTAMVAAAYLAGQDIVRDCMEDPLISSFVSWVIGREIIPTLDLPLEELQAFSLAVQDRFRNPFIDHQLLSIALNSTSKWKARVLPTIEEYVRRKDALPLGLTFGFAAYLAFYSGGRLDGQKMVCQRDGQAYEIMDELPVLEFFAAHHGEDPGLFAKAVCGNVEMWGQDLNGIPGFTDGVAKYLKMIREKGCRSTLEQVMG